MEVTRQFARFIVDTGYDDLPPEAVAASKRALLDTMGVALAGSQEPPGKLVVGLVRRLQSAPRATVIGNGLRTSAPEAAQANGTIAHALDYDDASSAAQGHPSVPLLGATFALAEDLGASGQQVTEAYVLGVEIWTAVGMALPGLLLRGWHPTAVLGPLGAAAAAAKLLRLDVDRTQMALGLAGSMAAGLAQNFGTMTKPFHAGNAARSGVVAALLAQDGFTATSQLFEGHFGYPVTFYPSGRYDLAEMTRGLGQPFSVVSPGISVKKYPSCYGTHPAIDGMIDLANQYDLKPDDVESVQVFVVPRRRGMLFYDNPTSGLEAKFSMPFCMAAALTDRRMGLRQVTDEKVNQPRMRELMRRARLDVHPDWKDGASEARPDVVIVRLKDGREYRQEAEKARGHADLPLSRDELLEKCRECAGLALGPDEVERSISLLENLEQQDRLVDLMALAGGSKVVS